jgi:GNAT superfamily N-acetyltransferase
MTPVAVNPVAEGDLDDLLPLMRGYCDFYEVAPPDDALLAMSRALIADPEREGVQFIARAPDRDALGFATIFWTWSTLQAARIAVMNDLFVVPSARGRRVGEALIARCVRAAGDHGAVELGWQTARDNSTAQRLYDRVGGRREEWVDYSLPARR